MTKALALLLGCLGLGVGLLACGGTNGTVGTEPATNEKESATATSTPPSSTAHDGVEVCDGKDNNGDQRVDEQGCPVATVANGTSTYMFVPQAKTWNDARAYCESFGYRLVTINDAAEQEFLDRTGAGAAYFTTYWIGFNDLSSEGKWTWTSGQPVTFQNWYEGQPDNAWQGEHCAEMHFWDGRVSRWNDQNCKSLRHFICEA